MNVLVKWSPCMADHMAAVCTWTMTARTKQWRPRINRIICIGCPVLLLKQRSALFILRPSVNL